MLEGQVNNTIINLQSKQLQLINCNCLKNEIYCDSCNVENRLYGNFRCQQYSKSKEVDNFLFMKYQFILRNLML